MTNQPLHIWYRNSISCMTLYGWISKLRKIKQSHSESLYLQVHGLTLSY